jgi:hypothetical protein
MARGFRIGVNDDARHAALVARTGLCDMGVAVIRSQEQVEKIMDILGHTVEDKITGFSGIATAYVTYLTGCNQVLVAPRQLPDGKPQEACWFDVQRLMIDHATPKIVLENDKTPGCDIPAPVR